MAQTKAGLGHRLVELIDIDRAVRLHDCHRHGHGHHNGHRHQVTGSGSGSGRAGLGSHSGSSGPLLSSTNDTRVILGRGYSNGQLTYTVPVSLASQHLNLQLDTGSSDMWVASTRCGTESCNGRQGLKVNRFDDTDDAVVDQNTTFSIHYLQGGASGGVKTTSVLLGDPDTSRLAVNSQAFASANLVSDEDLDTGGFSGVLGMGLPALSIIQASLNDTSDTAALNEGVAPPDTGSILAGLWRNSRQGRRFVGLGLQRLEEDGGSGSSVLTVGTHDPAYSGTDLSKITYSPVVPDPDGISRHWRLYMTQMTVSIDGVTSVIPIGSSSATGSGYPIAVLDTSASVNLGPASVLNALYGAWGIGPASDGGYYMRCDLQLNITVTLGGVSVPIHPLDASVYANTGTGTGSSNPRAACIGSFQALRSSSGGSGDSSADAVSLPADFVLSPAFLRSAYTVLSCDGTNTSDGPAGPCEPQVGLRPLVNMTEATAQFTQVRVQKQPLGHSGLDGSESDDPAEGSKGLSGGIRVMIGCVAAIVVIAAIFGVALWRLRKRRRLIAARRAAMLASSGEKGDLARQETGNGVLRRLSSRGDGLLMPMTVLTKDDDDDESANGVLSPAQRAKARQLKQMHGVFDDELIGDDDNDPERAAAGLAPRWRDDARGRAAGTGTNSGLQVGTTSWDVSSTGYIDARKVKREYLRKLNEEERQIFANPAPASAADGQAGNEAGTEAEGMMRGTSYHTLDRSSNNGSDGQHRSDSPSPLLGPRDRS
ncbi:uncharacterized protein PFL1_04509 [Pseudozyma flocculosa PF-1]|uniref:Peptidase A1 domain-containing protein n=1 Tax=Pseudozyma flocculosa PF-1 TaxID=1277687 RepID=A0A061H536_9BASI|nr:uncharacterized protein PFL1_04509 [Pseudozyma flocculosa PF-1]EPQ27763.1 hypothetical protein PFL1_04509 [Pseudozyma flocculosa PF-1]